MATVMMGFSISLDGFIAPDGGEGDAGLHDWLFGGSIPFEEAGTEFAADSPQSIAVFRDTVAAMGAVVAGRTAFGNGDEPFFDLPTFVLTHRPPAASPNPKLIYVSEGIERALELAAEAAGVKQVCIFGGAQTAQQYLAAGLVNELRLTVVPTLFGSGLRLFGPDTPNRKLELVSSVATPTVTHLHLRLT